ncbi:MAG: nucleoside phosphorylase [Flavipsychrobacter sp.]
MPSHFNDTIGASQLLLNKRGAVYHLDLKADQIADTIITVGDPNRVKKVAQYFDKIEHRSSNREFITNTGYIGKKRLTILSTGIGPDNIDIVLNELDALANIDLKTRTINTELKKLNIIRLGTCGSLQSDIPVDSFIVSNYAIGMDNLLHYYNYDNNTDEQFILNEFIQHNNLSGKYITPYIAQAPVRLLSHFTKGYIHGITATCPGFYGPQGRKLRGNISLPYLLDALKSFNSRGQKILNYEMETSAIYGLSKILGHNCVSISTVVANRADETTSQDADAAIEKMIQQSLSIIEKI